jgi:hypothetical protein
LRLCVKLSIALSHTLIGPSQRNLPLVLT